MKIPSDLRSCALLAFTLFGSSFVSALSVDLKDAAPLQPRLDDAQSSKSKSKCSSKATGTISLAAVSSKSKTKCSGKASGTTSTSAAGIIAGLSAYGTASASAGLGLSANNGSSLASMLPYGRTSKKSKCKVTGTTYLGSQPTGSASLGNSLVQHTTGNPDSGNDSSPTRSPTPPASVNAPEKVAGSQSQISGSDNSQLSTVSSGMATQPSHTANGGNYNSPAGTDIQPSQTTSVGNYNSPADTAATCSPQSIVTITVQNTVTVTAAASATSLNGALPDSYAPMVSSLEALVAASSTNSSEVKTKCTGGPKYRASGTVASTGVFPSGTGSLDGGKNITVPVGTSLPSKKLIDKKSIGNQASTAAVSSETVVSSEVSKISPLTATDNASSIGFQGQFWAGATIGTLMRMEAIPGRIFYDYDGTTVKDPVKTLAGAGVNAIRIEATRGQCLGPTKFDSNATTRGAELTFTLDWGCIDIQVQTAQRAVALGMRVVLTINQGFTIPAKLESLSYSQMIDNIQTETKRQLQPFLTAKILPDIILLENEGPDGFLFAEASTGHIRGTNDGKASPATIDKELCGQIPTGNMVSYPQLAGYYKAEIIAAQAAITATGSSTATVRFGLHSHRQHVQWKEGIVHGSSPPSQSQLETASHAACPDAQPIPADILAQNISQMLTIAGFSAYPDPMTPTNVTSASSQAATLTRLTQTLTQLQGYAEPYAKYTDGPFQGQYKLQGLGVEYGTSFTVEQVPQEQALTELMWKTVKGFGAFLGVLWYEP